MMKDPYLYPNSDVLKNLANVRDSEELNNLEADYTLFRLSEVAEDESPEKFNFQTLCELHYRIFQDVYDWAGKPRVINIEKAEAVLGDVSVEYSDCFDIAKDAEKILERANNYDWGMASFEDIIETFSSFMAELWKVHPFREGNTRTVVMFCSMFIEAQGLYIESDLFKDNAAYMRNALVAANAIFDDLGGFKKTGISLSHCSGCAETRTGTERAHSKSNQGKRLRRYGRKDSAGDPLEQKRKTRTLAGRNQEIEV